MNIWIDGSVFDTFTSIGCWRVSYEIICRLSKLTTVTLWIRNNNATTLPSEVVVQKDSGRLYKNRWDLFSRVKRIVSNRFPPKSLKCCDIFHSTFYSLSPSAEIPAVQTVYDLFPEKYYYLCGDWRDHHIEIKKKPLSNATLIMSISQSTANDLSQFYPDCKDKVRVVHLGADHIALAKDKQYSLQSNNYAVYVGRRDSYNNFKTVLDAMLTSAWPRQTRLQIIGTPFSSNESQLIKALDLSNKIDHLGPLDDEKMSHVVRGAVCQLVPSMMEGFGLPVLESQMNQCPVVCSDIPVFREVAGEAAIYFDPRLGEKLAEAVATAAESKTRCQLIESGVENAKKFTWDKAAEQTLALY